MVKIAVIGAGVVGLSTALQVKQNFPFCSVTVVAEKFNTETTSDGAGGLFRPNFLTLSANPLESIKQWSQDTFSHFNNLFNSPEASDCGIALMSGFLLSNKEKLDMIEDISLGQSKMTAEQIAKMGFDCKHVTKVLTYTMECRRYMPWLTSKFLSLGGSMHHHRLKSLEELVGVYDVVVNCSGLGAKDLVPDPLVYPVKGQLIQVEAPWVKHFYFFEDDTYVIPNINRTSLGGIRIKNDYSTEVDPEISKSIWQRCTSRIPSLQKAKVLWEWAGLRPHRDPIRIEQDVMNFPKGTLKVVHNYGHGANGVSLSWGTAKHATRLVRQFLENDPELRSKL
ncbi:D-aspartate oxidase [Octopus sinensis]|uniref:D-aspartate oxidase n=2 Tax=Octopus TaxID=6643 RepID=OXDD_OCTVU|nr:D-aspartate oxidase [Octopus sinensis]